MSKAFIRKLAGLGPDRDKWPVVQPCDDPAEFKHYIFICGLHRSGTTLMESVIRSHFDIAALQAPVPENEGQHLQDVFSNARAFGGPGRFAFAPEMHMKAPPEAECAALRQRLMQCWTPWLTGSSDAFLEKSPPNLTKIEWLRAVFPGARFVIVTRDPRVVAAATIKWSKTSIHEMVFHWQVAHQSALDASGDDCLWVRYEEYCEAPDATLTRLQDFLPVAPSADVSVSDERFAKPRNSNSSYLDEIGPAYYGKGIWTELGYDF